MRTLILLASFITIPLIVISQTDTTETTPQKIFNKDFENEMHPINEDVETIIEKKNSSKENTSDDWDTSDYEVKKLKSSDNSTEKENGVIYSSDWEDFKNEFKNIKKEMTYKKKRHSRNFAGHYASFDIGLSTIMSPNNGFSLLDNLKLLEIDLSRSLEISFNPFQQEIPINRRMGFVTGIGMTWNNYRFDNPATKLEHNKNNTNSLGISTVDTVEWKKSKLSTFKINVPLLFEVQFSNYWLEIGGFATVKLGSKNKRKTSDGDKFVEKRNYYLNPIQYGLILRTGYEDFGIYVQYALSPYFKKNTKYSQSDDIIQNMPDLYTISLGLTVAFN